MPTKLYPDAQELTAVHFDANPYYKLVVKICELQPDSNLGGFLVNGSRRKYLENKNYNWVAGRDEVRKNWRSITEPVFIPGNDEVLISESDSSRFQCFSISSDLPLDIPVRPDVAKMEKLFGINTSIFYDVKYLEDTRPIARKGFSFSPEQFDKFQRIFIVHRFSFSDQDYHNLYFISLRFGEKRDVNGKVSFKKGRFVAEHDADMRAAYVDYQDETIVTFKKCKAKRSNPSGSRYRVFDELMLKTIPWLMAEFGLKQNRARYVFILLLITAGYDDIKTYFNSWAETKKRKDIFNPFASPLSSEFLKHFENALKPKDQGRRVTPFFIALKQNPCLHVNDKVVPAVIKSKIISSIGPRPLTPEEITKIKIMYKRFEMRFRKANIWPA